MATAARKKAEATTEITIMEVQRGILDVCILGTSPLIMHCMSDKAWHELIAPLGRKTTADKQSTLKHNPLQEFLGTPYYMEDNDAPTLLGLMPTMFKRAMGTAALDMPGANKAQIGRLVYVRGERVPVYGVPRVFMSIVRNSDINHTPDVRTRAILPEWACRLTLEYTAPILRQQSIVNLLSAAGFQSGVGDWRQEKGSGSYGSFTLCSHDNPSFVRIMKTMAREAQVEALRNPVAYDTTTSEMLAWFDVEIKRRGFSPDGQRQVEQTAQAVPAKTTRKRTTAVAEVAPVVPAAVAQKTTRGRKPNGAGNGATNQFLGH